MSDLSVQLLESMPAEDLESAIVKAARISFAQSTKTKDQDEKLIRYLYRNKHTSPFEMVRFKFLISCPIFVARQILRHRTANVNEFSQRYAEVGTEDEDYFYRPSQTADGIRMVHSTNKQSSVQKEVSDEIKQKFINIEQKLDSLYLDYKELVSLGVAKECARFCLPVSTYTQFIFCLDLHNLIKFLRLRMDVHTQLETRKVANQIFELIKDKVPVTISCFIEEQDQISLSKREIKGLIANDKDLEFKSLSQKEDYLSLFNL